MVNLYSLAKPHSPLNRSFIKNRKNRNSGFTLIEIVLVSGIISVVGVLSASLIVTILKSYHRSNSTSQVNRVGQTLTSIFEAQIRNAANVSIESEREIQYTITSDSGDAIRYSLRFIPKNCSLDNSNNLVSLSSSSTLVFPESSVTPTNIDTGVNVTSVVFSEVQNTIEFEFTLGQACNLPLTKNEFIVSKTYSAKVVPRFNYAN